MEAQKPSDNERTAQSYEEEKLASSNMGQEAEKPINSFDRAQRKLEEIRKELSGRQTDRTPAQLTGELQAMVDMIKATGIEIKPETEEVIQSEHKGARDRAMERMKETGDLIKMQSILKYTTIELSESEPRIEKPMHPDCKVAVCVPAHSESSDIIRMLDSLAQQDGISVSAFEVIINVNNTDRVDEETRERNNDTLSIVKLLSGEDVSEDELSFLEPDERERLEMIMSSGLVVHLIDQSTEGHEVDVGNVDDEDELEHNGLRYARKRTMDEVSERFVLAGMTDGIIASLDSDTVVNREWIKGIIAQFEDTRVAMLAGERRDGRSIGENGEEASSDDVFNEALVNWNTEGRRNDETLGQMPDIETAEQRINIRLAHQMIRSFNTERSRLAHQDEASEDRGHFKGGSGKMFRVSTYVQHPTQIINVMDGGAKLPEGLSSEYGSLEYTEEDDLAVYPETRVRSWDLDQEEFEALRTPLGSSGKELAYSIKAGLEERIPSYTNPDRSQLADAIRGVFSSEQATKEEATKTLVEVYNVDRETIDTLRNSGIAGRNDLEAAIRTNQPIMDLIMKIINSVPETAPITEVLTYYGQQRPELSTPNPEIVLFKALAKELLSDDLSEIDRTYIKKSIKKLLLSVSSGDEEKVDKLVGQMDSLVSEDELVALSESDSILGEFLENTQEEISLSEAAKKYEEIFAKQSEK